MKLIFAIVGIEDAPNVQSSLTGEGYIVTKLATTGGFLNAGNITFLTATDDDRVDTCIQLIQKNSSRREKDVPAGTVNAAGIDANPGKVTVGGAVVFVLNVEQCVKM